MATKKKAAPQKKEEEKYPYKLHVTYRYKDLDKMLREAGELLDTYAGATIEEIRLQGPDGSVMQ